jgi:hypothetical protein
MKGFENVLCCAVQKKLLAEDSQPLYMLINILYLTSVLADPIHTSLHRVPNRQITASHSSLTAYSQLADRGIASKSASSLTSMVPRASGIDLGIVRLS